MDSDFVVDIEEVKKDIEKAECIVLYFPMLEKTLVLDTRFDAAEGPLIRVMPRADSVEERFQSLRRLRPRFPTPETFTLVPWPKYVASLKRLGVWEKIVERIQASGSVAAMKACDHAFEELLRLESQEMGNAISGQHYKSLWESKK